MRAPGAAAPFPADESREKRRRLIEALEAADGNQSRAAGILGVSRVTVWHWMKKYNIRFDRRIDKSGQDKGLP
jgi:transcriptional regulator of acetoin/glycerol metabolism